MKLERPDLTFRNDFGDKTVIMRSPPRLLREWQPVATTLRMIPVARPAPPATEPVRAPEPVRTTSPSVPALVCDVDATDEIELARAQFRRGTSKWAVLAGVLVAAGIFGCMMIVGKPTAAPVAASAPPPDTSDSVLERERAVRAARAQGQWVELGDSPPATPPVVPNASSAALVPCSPLRPDAPLLPCTPSAPLPAPPPAPTSTGR